MKYFHQDFLDYLVMQLRQQDLQQHPHRQFRQFRQPRL